MEIELRQFKTDVQAGPEEGKDRCLRRLRLTLQYAPSRTPEVYFSPTPATARDPTPDPSLDASTDEPAKFSIESGVEPKIPPAGTTRSEVPTKARDLTKHEV